MGQKVLHRMIIFKSVSHQNLKAFMLLLDSIQLEFKLLEELENI
jgi:hypothetical protein